MNAESEISSGKQQGTGTGAFPFHPRMTTFSGLLLQSTEAVKITSVNTLIHLDSVYYLSKAQSTIKVTQPLHPTIHCS